MKLSIISVNLNNSTGLRGTIESVIFQTYTDFEFIIFDRYSTDDSVEVIKEHQEKITYWASEPDLGIYNAMNKGISKAKGDYCLFLNSGDELVNNGIIEEVFQLKEISEFDIIYGNLKRTFPDSTTAIIKMPDHITPQFLIDATLCHPVTFIKRDLFSRFGKYREDLKIVSDWAFFLKAIIFAKTTQHYVNRVISNFRMDGSNCNEINQQLIAEERRKIIDESFSSDLLTICNYYSKYKRFHEKKIFRFIRRARRKIFGVFKISTYKNYAIWKRNRFLMKIFDRNIRNQLRNPHLIPVVIINYNRLNDLRKIINFLLTRGHENILIIDNNSDFAPLLEYYDEVIPKVKVIRMKKNWGHMVFWENREIFSQYSSGFYIVTDSDILPNEDLPKNYLYEMIHYLLKYHDITKVGFALKIDDIPDTYRLKNLVIAWEKKFWENEIEEKVYKAMIDTTFALYLPNYHPNLSNFYNALRLSGDYCARHSGWYINHNCLSNEEQHYIKTSNQSNSWKTDLDGNFIKMNNNIIYENSFEKY